MNDMSPRPPRPPPPLSPPPEEEDTTEERLAELLERVAAELAEEKRLDAPRRPAAELPPEPDPEELAMEAELELAALGAAEEPEDPPRSPPPDIDTETCIDPPGPLDTEIDMPPRPPRICGTIKVAAFSARVTPVSRSVRSKLPLETVAVRVAMATGPPPPSEGNNCPRNKYRPTPAMASTPSQTSQ
jgi:hypothetical protein